MTPEQKAAFINSQTACMMAEMAGMQAFNRSREVMDLSPGYDETHFNDLEYKYGLGHNTVLIFLQGDN